MTVPCRVAVVGGGRNCEHDVSIASAKAIAAALDPTHNVVALTIGRDGVWLDPDHRPLGSTPADSLAGAVRVLDTCDVLLPVVHGPLGEDGTLAGLAALAGIRCAGSGLTAGAVGMDKWLTKVVAAEAGIRTARAVLVRVDEAGVCRPGLDKLCAEIGTDVVVKPVSAGSSYGVAAARTHEQLHAAVSVAAGYDSRVLVEERLIGREVDIAVMRTASGELIVSAPLEIVAAQPDSPIFDTTTKYDGSARFLVPAPMTAAEFQQLRELAVRVFETLGCAGVARIDFFRTDIGWVLNEINTMPGMTEHSQVPRMFASLGVTYPDLLAELVAAAT